MANTAIGRLKQVCNKYNIELYVWLKHIENGLKWCFKCKSWQEIGLFNIDNSRYDRRAASCQKCTRVKIKTITKGRISVFKGKTHTEASKAIMRVKNAGVNNPNWKGGITILLTQIRNTARYKTWRQAVYLKDNFTCQKCFTKKMGKNIILDADHIIPLAKMVFESNIKTVAEALNIDSIFDITNGRCLCRKCHKETDTWGVNINKSKQWGKKQISVGATAPGM